MRRSSARNADGAALVHDAPCVHHVDAIGDVEHGAHVLIDDERADALGLAVNVSCASRPARPSARAPGSARRRARGPARRPARGRSTPSAARRPTCSRTRAAAGCAAPERSRSSPSVLYGAKRRTFGARWRGCARRVSVGKTRRSSGTQPMPAPGDPCVASGVTSRPCQFDGAAARGREAQDRAQRRGLAGAARAEQRDDLARGDRRATRRTAPAFRRRYVSIARDVQHAFASRAPSAAPTDCRAAPAGVPRAIT